MQSAYLEGCQTRDNRKCAAFTHALFSFSYLKGISGVRHVQPLVRMHQRRQLSVSAFDIIWCCVCVKHQYFIRVQILPLVVRAQQPGNLEAQQSKANRICIRLATHSASEVPRHTNESGTCQHDDASSLPVVQESPALELYICRSPRAQSATQPYSMQMKEPRLVIGR